jgi:hypothetical protein
MTNLNPQALNTLDDIIERYKKDPWRYDNNEYVCYEACKSEIRKLERQRAVEYNDYDKYIEYITEKLGI